MTEEQVLFSFDKVYLKDVSYEAPGTPGVFLTGSEPTINIQIRIDSSPVEGHEGVYEVVIIASVRAENNDKSTLFLIEIQQAGLFTVKGLGDDDLPRALQVNCPEIIFPYLRETATDLTGKGGFPPFLLQPINFEALYEQKLASDSDQQAAQN